MVVASACLLIAIPSSTPASLHVFGFLWVLAYSLVILGNVTFSRLFPHLIVVSSFLPVISFHTAGPG